MHLSLSLLGFSIQCCVSWLSRVCLGVCGVAHDEFPKGPNKLVFIYPEETLTWFGAFSHRAIVHLVMKLRPVVVHVDHVDVQIDWILHLVTVHVHCVRSQLGTEQKAQTRTGSLELNIVCWLELINVACLITGPWLDCYKSVRCGLDWYKAQLVSISCLSAGPRYPDGILARHHNNTDRGKVVKCSRHKQHLFYC